MAKSCKFYKQQRQVSYDNGVTWIPLDEYQKGALIEVNSSDCTSPSPKIYRWAQTEDTICVFDGKFMAKYNNGQTYEIPCDGNPTLTSGNTHPSGYELSSMTDAVIGDCVTSIGENAFYQCKSLTSITIPNSVTSIGGWSFWDCESLTRLNSDVDGVFNLPSGVTSIEDATFQHCRSLTHLRIPNSVTSIGFQAFVGCYNLESVVIPSGVTSIDDSAFFTCSGLTSITVEAVMPPTLGSLAFDRTNSCPIYVLAAYVNTYKAASGWSNYASRIQAIP